LAVVVVVGFSALGDGGDVVDCGGGFGAAWAAELAGVVVALEDASAESFPFGAARVAG
jgi:hypothetical protein